MSPVLFAAIDSFVGCGNKSDWRAPPPSVLDIQSALMSNLSNYPLSGTIREAVIPVCLLRGERNLAERMCRIMANPRRNMTWVFEPEDGYEGCLRLMSPGARSGRFRARPPPVTAAGVPVLDDWSDLPDTWDLGPTPTFSRDCEVFFGARSVRRTFTIARAAAQAP